jgi:hypothetical protein
MPENKEATPATEALQDVAKASDAKAEATSTAKASDELTEDDLDAVAGGTTRDGKGGLIVDPLKN